MPELDTSVPILIFKTGKFPLHHGILGIIRSLGTAGVPVYAILEDPLVPAGLSRHLSGKFIWNPGEDATDELLAGLRAIGERIGRPAVLIPTNDHTAIFIEDHASALAPWYRFPRQTPGLARSFVDKQRLEEHCRKVGMPYPKTIFPTSLAEVTALADGLAFPLVAKIVRPWERPRPPGITSTAIVANRAELLELFQRAEGPPRAGLLLQELIPSAGGADAMYAAYCDDRSRCLVSLTGEKLRSYPANAGMTSAARTTDNQALRAIAENFLASIGFRGIVDLEFRQDLRDGQYKLLDFNPRVGAQFRLYENAAGIDVVRAMHLDLTGRPVPQDRSVKERLLIVENYDLLVFERFRRAAGLPLTQWLRVWKGKCEWAWFSPHDLLPWLAMWPRWFGTYLMQRLRPRRQSRAPSDTRFPRFLIGRGHARSDAKPQPRPLAVPPP